MNNIHRLKMQLAHEGWEVEDRITSQGWGDSIGYSIWVKRWDWHGKMVDVQFNRHVSNANNEVEIEKALEEEHKKGCLVKKNLIIPFSDFKSSEKEYPIPLTNPSFIGKRFIDNQTVMNDWEME